MQRASNLIGVLLIVAGILAVRAGTGKESELMTEFFDRLVNVCAPEMAAAVNGNDMDRASAVIQGLATMLERSIARAACGDAAEIDKILMGCEHRIAAEAAGIAGVINLAATMRARRG